MYILTEARYQPVESSRFLPEANLPELANQTLQAAAERGSRQAIRELMQRLGEAS